MELFLPITAALITGFATAAQGPTNAALGLRVGAVQASLVSFLGGLVILGLLCPFFGQGDFYLVFTAEPWKWLGGAYAVYIVFAMTYTTPHLGAALCLTLVMLGQLTGAMVIDGFGLLETTPVAISTLRVAGCLFVLVGIILVYIGRRRQDEKLGVENATPSNKMLVCVILSFTAGLASAIQTPTNAAMSSIIGTLEASTLSFIVGVSIMLVMTLIMNKGRILSMKGLKAWKFTGGVYGAIGVPCLTFATPALGVSLALCYLMVAQLLGAILVDAFGWLETRKTRVDKLRIVGSIAVAIGVVLVTLSKM